jgi:CRISPR-associated endonuclease/helicase Cas3
MAVMGWLWRRRFADDGVRRATPRRLIYCLPMRVLVRQIRDAAHAWLKRLGLQDAIGLHVLMGGEEHDDWDLYPERDAILVGTQDTLLSRALNRGYAMSRARWPMHFALLNNDAVWVLDEVQLMGVGLATTTQLAAFRQFLGTCAPAESVWMSATLDPDWLRTVDLDPGTLEDPLNLDQDDRAMNAVRQRCEASKQLTRAAASAAKPAALAEEILAAHRKGTRTLAVVNTVGRAQVLAREVRMRVGSGPSVPELVLIHSRFRAPDRKRQTKRLLTEPGDAGTIVVATQVVEAGADLSAKTLFTEVAPWASLVQRFGRCNRGAEFSNADPGKVYWIDLDGLDGDAKETLRAAAPYPPEELRDARQRLEDLKDGSVAPDALDALDIRLPFEHNHVIRRRDLVELFDTTPDLTGNDLDIDRYVRDTDDTDARVFWRELGGESPRPEEPSSTRDELCPAPVGELRPFLKKLDGLRAYRRNFLEGTWDPVSDRGIVPGQVYLLDSAAGGYDPERGWDPRSARRVKVVAAAVGRAADPDDYDQDGLSKTDRWQTIAEHTEDVCGELDAILRDVGIPGPQRTALTYAARWHDWGKAHDVFQGAVKNLGRPPAWDGCRVVAKAPGKRKDKAGNVVAPGFWTTYSRKHFRHELASAIGLLIAPNGMGEAERDLVAYLVAAHHGKVRLSIRSLPGERRPDGRRFAHGVWDGDQLPETDLGGGVRAPPATLSLELMELGLSEQPPFAGQPSWADRALSLRNTLGPFRLAYLEALLRAADMRASARAAARHSPTRPC